MRSGAGAEGRLHIRSVEDLETALAKASEANHHRPVHLVSGRSIPRGNIALVACFSHRRQLDPGITAGLLFYGRPPAGPQGAGPARQRLAGRVHSGLVL